MRVKCNKCNKCNGCNRVPLLRVGGRSATRGLYSRPCRTTHRTPASNRPVKVGCCTSSTSTAKPKRQRKRKAKPADGLLSFQRRRPTRQAKPEPWPPVAYALAESLALSWDQDAPFCADLSGKRPAFRIYAEAQKARRDEVLPMTPDFAQWLLQTPEAERHGRVFKLNDVKTDKPIRAKLVSVLVSAIGKKAGVVVNKAEGKYASAHDLRRAFGTRWAKRVMPALLKRLMRHASIDTTMTYYVDLDAADVADQLWATYAAPPGQGNISGNIDPSGAKKREKALVNESAET